MHGCLLRALPDRLGELEKLEQLFVSSNYLGTLPDSIGCCRQLRVLSCNNNALSALPASLAQLPLLANVNAANNVLVTLPAALARRWRAVLSDAIIESCCEEEPEVDSGASPLPKSLVVVLDRNPLLAGAEVVPAIAASQMGQQSIVEELRSRKKVKH